MDQNERRMAQEIAQVASAFQIQRTGHAPQSVTVVLNRDTLVITLHEALTPAERALASSSEGAAKVQEFHRQLFQNSSNSLRREISRITGRNVREGAAEVETATGAVVHAFTTGTMVQVFLLAEESLSAIASQSSPRPSPKPLWRFDNGRRREECRTVGQRSEMP